MQRDEQPCATHNSRAFALEVNMCFDVHFGITSNEDSYAEMG